MAQEELNDANGPQMSEALQRELDEVLGKTEESQPAPPAPSEQQSQAAPPAPADQQALAEAEAKAKEYLDLLQRSQASFQNYKKRVEQERQDLRDQLRSEVIARFLPVLDDLNRALKEVPADLAGNPWVQGVAMVQRKLVSLLDAEGVTRMEAQGQPFDPYSHEAVHHQESEEQAEGTVLAVFRDGYKLGGRVVRPAQVIVARRPSTPGQATPHKEQKDKRKPPADAAGSQGGA